MERIEDPELSREILNHLADLYGIYTKREGIHLSTLTGCITRSFFDQTIQTKPTDEEVMLFALGYGLQDVLTPKQAIRIEYSLDGVTFSPDFQIVIGGDRTVEIKTTRASSDKPDFPEPWLVYIKGGCYILKIKEYSLSILHMMGNWKPPFPKIASWKLKFTEEELLENWEYIIARKDVYEEALILRIPPTPYKYCYEWECPKCRYKMQCEAISLLGNAPVDKMVDKKKGR